MAKKIRRTTPEVRAIPIAWQDPYEKDTLYANNLRIQRTPYDVFLYFYEVQPPMIERGAPDRDKQLAEIQSVNAKCVAKIMVPIDRIADFARAISSVLPEAEPIATIKDGKES